MPSWKYRVRLKHLFCEAEDLESVQRSMSAIADVLEKAPYFERFAITLKKFRAIPSGDEVFGPVDYANRLMDRLYDFADNHRIWIE